MRFKNFYRVSHGVFYVIIVAIGYANGYANCDKPLQNQLFKILKIKTPLIYKFFITKSITHP